ncbi:poly(A)-specific ribonuclease PNLDC1-like isoform X1 [Clytia hemisphaerica]|uniref:Uncharacterized protein n=2 Tax=Clytia hemisphaerica TaxID=252671 RepID=A0A7M5VBV9_9CNID
MCDVTKENFNRIFPTIEWSIRNSEFIAIDGEFTGLSTSNTFEPTLFDTPKERYAKLKRSLSKFTLCQLGLACFVRSTKIENSYDTYVFNIYSCPASFGSIDSKFTCQASALKFLTEHHFDFNKFVKEGVPYLNRDQRVVLYEHHKAGMAIPSMLLKQIDDKYVKPIIKLIEEFLVSDLKNDHLELPYIPNGIELYVVLRSIEKRFTNLECSFNEDDKIAITRVLDEKQKVVFEPLYEKILQDTVGVSRVLDLIAECKKPLIGHNFLGDLIMIYERFFHRLPQDYHQFKKRIHDNFHQIFDTKHIANNLRREFRDLNFPDFTNLQDLFTYFSRSEGFHHRIYTPKFILNDICKKYESGDHPHEAGFDAYSTGFIFLRMAHLLATKNIKLTDEKPLDLTDHFYVLKIFVDGINMSRAAVRHVNLNGDDPPSTLPERFIVRSRKKKKPLSANQVAQDFLPFGSVDVRLRSNNEAIIAVSHRKRAKNLVKAFAMNKFYIVEEYDWWKHSKEASKLRLSGSVTVTILSLATVVYLWKRYQ